MKIQDSAVNPSRGVGPMVLVWLVLTLCAITPITSEIRPYWLVTRLRVARFMGANPLDFPAMFTSRPPRLARTTSRVRA